MRLWEKNEIFRQICEDYWKIFCAPIEILGDRAENYGFMARSIPKLRNLDHLSLSKITNEILRNKILGKLFWQYFCERKCSKIFWKIFHILISFAITLGSQHTHKYWTLYFYITIIWPITKKINTSGFRSCWLQTTILVYEFGWHFFSFYKCNHFSDETT